MGKIQAVLFDMDGLLMDSERVGVQVSLAVSREMGYCLTEEDVLKTLGITREGLKRIYEAKEPSFDCESFLSRFTARMTQLAQEGKIPLKPGAMTLLDVLRERGIPCVLATSSPGRIADVYLEKAGVRAYFRDIVSGDDHLPSKPNPDMFLAAARKAGADIRNCLVLEDSPNGLKAGRASGATVVMVPDLIPWTEALAPYTDAVLPSLADAVPLLDA